MVHRLESLCYYPVPPGQPIVPIKGIKQGCYCPLDTFPFELLTKIGLSLERKTSFLKMVGCQVITITEQLIVDFIVELKTHPAIF